MASDQPILRLPDEVLGKICKQFCPHCAGEDCLRHGAADFSGPEYYGTLDSLTRVNVRIGRQAQLVRFHFFPGGYQSLPKFVRTLVEQPDLAAQVRVVRLGDRDADQHCVLQLPFRDRDEAARFANKFRISVMAGFDDRNLLSPFKKLAPAEDTFHCAPLRGPVFSRHLPPLAAPSSSIIGMVSRLFRVGSVELAGGPSPVLAAPAGFDGTLTAWRQERIANARLNAFALFKLAKNIKSVAILSEWPLAVFELFPTANQAPAQRRIRVTQGRHGIVLRVDLDCTVPLGRVEELRLDSDNLNLEKKKYIVDLEKSAPLVFRLPSLRTLQVRGGTGALVTPGLLPHNFTRLSVLDLVSCSITAASLKHILAHCSAQLTHFRITLAGDHGHIGSTMVGFDVVDALADADLTQTLTTLAVDTSSSETFSVGWDDARSRFRTLPSMADFSRLQHLSISADSIYFPSQYPRVLLRDRDQHVPNPGERLLYFLPAGLRSLEITGIYAIFVDDMKNLARECRDGLFPHLRRVVLKSGGEVRRGSPPYELPGAGDDLPYDDFQALSLDADVLGQYFDDEVAKLFADAGVQYEFDRPEFYFDRFCGSWDD